MGDNEELSVDQETVDQKVDQPEIGDEPQPQNSTDDFDPKKHTRVQTGANGELCFQGLTQAEVEERIADGQVNAIQDSSNRSVKDIVKHIDVFQLYQYRAAGTSFICSLLQKHAVHLYHHRKYADWYFSGNQGKDYA